MEILNAAFKRFCFGITKIKMIKQLVYVLRARIDRRLKVFNHFKSVCDKLKMRLGFFKERSIKFNYIESV